MTSRAGANLSPEPLTNWSLSLLEDVLAVGAVGLAVSYPLVMLAVILVFLLLMAWILPKVLRRIIRMLKAAADFFRGRKLEAR